MAAKNVKTVRLDVKNVRTKLSVWLAKMGCSWENWKNNVLLNAQMAFMGKRKVNFVFLAHPPV